MVPLGTKCPCPNLPPMGPMFYFRLGLPSLAGRLALGGAVFLAFGLALAFALGRGVGFF